ncbi:unnamed protein product [Brassica oleracea var. botrytis]|uniref:(rape) hypothetical protein n=1 Tax=Brassica napus TaxID=3708 RepID=A0A816UVB7_BRANA|nr:unnamed protein product [Brassica napus]
MSGGGGGAFVNGRVVGVGFARRCIACALAFFMVFNQMVLIFHSFKGFSDLEDFWDDLHRFSREKEASTVKEQLQIERDKRLKKVWSYVLLLNMLLGVTGEALSSLP